MSLRMINWEEWLCGGNREVHLRLLIGSNYQLSRLFDRAPVREKRTEANVLLPTLLDQCQINFGGVIMKSMALWGNEK